MPYKKYYKKSKKSKNVSKPMQKAIQKVVNRSLSKEQEEKYQVFYLATNVDYSGAIVDVTAISQGDTDTTRDGDEIMPKSLNIRGTFVNADSTNAYRLIVFRYKNDTSLTGNPAMTNILNLTASVTAPFQSYYHDARKTYNILHDSMYVTDTNNSIRKFNLHIPLARKSVNYINGATTGINKIYVGVISDSAASTHPAVSLVAEIRYTDS